MKDLHFSSVRLTGWTGRPHARMPGWAGTPVDVWRLMSAGTWWHALIARPNQAMLDWLDPFLDLRAIALAHASWNRLWLYEVTVDEVPREWLRWAVMLLQGVRKVTAGTPADNQIAMYTYLADQFVSGDKALVEIINKVRGDAPKPVASATYLPEGAEPVNALCTLVHGGAD